MKRTAPSLFVAAFLLACITSAFSATITSVGVDDTTNDAWRTTDVAKPLDSDGDNIYGTDGYMISSFEPVDTDPRNTLVVPYATYGVDGGVVGQEGPDQVAHQSMFDDVTQTGVGPVPDVSAGDWYVRGGGVADYQPFFTITLSEAASFRLGVITDQTPDNPTGLIGESSDAVRVDGPGGTTASLELAGKDAVPDYVLFDITGDAGDVFTILGRNDLRWQDNGLGGFFLDPLVNPNAPEIASFTADPTETDTPNTAINFTWQVEVPVDSLLLQPGDIDVWTNDTNQATGAGGFTLDPGPDETTTYRLEATLGGETGIATVRVAIIPPEIVSFTSDKASIAPGESFTLSWEVTPPITSLTLEPGDIDVLTNDTDPGTGVGGIDIIPGPSENTTYRLVAVRGASATDTAETVVQVVIPGQAITLVGVDFETNDGWRTTDVVKPFGDADNVYGTEGYLIAQKADRNDPADRLDPPYATVELDPTVTGYEGANTAAHQGVFDDVTETPGPGPIPDGVCGDFWKPGGGDGNVQPFFIITLTETASFRLGVIGDQTNNTPVNLFWEASRGVQVTGPNGGDSGVISIVGPTPGDESWRNGDVDYMLFDISGQIGDVFTVWGENDSRWKDHGMGGVFFDPTGGPRGPRFSVERSGDDLLFKWDSQGGKLYNLLSETDPSVAEPIDWTVFGVHQDIEATPPENTLTIPYPADAKRFFVISEFNAPPASIFEEDFEGGQGGWTTGSEGDLGTLWEVGAPTNVGPAAAHGGTNCYGTNLAADYTLNAVVWLRSPLIDLTNAAGATLNFFHYVNIEEGFDLGRVSVLDATDDSLIAVIESPIDEQDPTDWEQFTKRIPGAALGQEVKIEFRLITDDFDDPGIGPFAGWYIDDVLVTVP